MIRNQTELNAFLTSKLSIVVESVARILTDKLIELIDDEVYSYNNTFYERTYQFRDSWEYTKPIIKGNIIESEIFQNYTIMTYVPEKWQHGSKYSGQLDENGLSEIINDGKIGNMANFPQIGSRPFWDKFKEYVNENINRIFIEECNKNGLITTGNIGTIFE